MKHELHTLPNGLRVVFAPVPQSATATVVVMTGTGSRYESEKENGLAHFLEHMFFKGTKKRRTARAISEELDALGSAYNAFTSKDRTAYYAKVSAQFLPQALDVISDIFLHSTLPSAEIEKERGAIIQEIDMYEDMPMHTIDNVFDELFFGAEHPLGRTILGPKENIRAFSRADFAAYLARNYVSANTVVCVAGAFSARAALSKIRKEFGCLSSSPAPAAEPFAPAQRAPRVAIREKKTDQTQLMLGVPAYPYLHHDEYALLVLAAILGGSMSSRLFLEVREKRGLAYSVHASAERFADTGYLAAQAGVEHGKLPQALATMLAEFRKLTKKEVPPAELEKTKSCLAGMMALSIETSDRLAQNAATSLLMLGRVRPLTEVLRGVQKVSAADVRRVAKDIIRTETLNLAVIGPHADPAPLASLLAA